MICDMIQYTNRPFNLTIQHYKLFMLSLIFNKLLP